MHGVVLAVVRRSAHVRLVDDRVGKERELGVADNGWNRTKLPWKVDGHDDVVPKVDRKVETSDEVVVYF